MKLLSRLPFFAALFLFSHAAYAQLVTGDAAPDFTLTDSNGNTHSISGEKGHYVVLEWTNPDCPFVKKHYGSGNMQSLQAEYTAKGVVWYSVASSAAGKQGSYTAGEWNDIVKNQKSAASAVLLDPDGKAGKLYGAQTTPHLFVISPDGKLIYQGAIDSIASPDPADISSAENYVKKALDESLAGKSVTTPSTKSYGCSVKY